jgi:hypothetical protein
LKTRLLAVAVLLALGMDACDRKPPARIAREAFSMTESKYCTNNIMAAEAALRQYLTTLAMQRRKGYPGIDFDGAEATTHERLFLIYRQTGATNQMEIEFAKTLECLDRCNRRDRLPPPKFTYDSLAQLIDISETNLHVGWKEKWRNSNGR